MKQTLIAALIIALLVSGAFSSIGKDIKSTIAIFEQACKVN